MGAILVAGGISFTLTEPDAFSQPRRSPGLVHIPARDGEHGVIGLVDIWWGGIPRAVVEVDEHDQRRSRRSFVAVVKGMVPCQSTHEDGGLVVDVAVELDVSQVGAIRCGFSHPWTSVAFEPLALSGLWTLMDARGHGLEIYGSGPVSGEHLSALPTGEHHEVLLPTAGRERVLAEGMTELVEG